MNKGEVAQAAWKGIIWRFLERCSSQLVSFIVSIILARLLLPEQYGIIAMTMIFVAISEVFITSGLGSALVQQSKYDERAFSTMFWASIVFSFLIYAVLFIIAPYISLLMHTPDLTIVLRILGLRLPISAMNSIQQAYVSQQMIFKKFFFSTLSGTISSGFIGLIMAYADFGVWALVGQNLMMTLVNTIALHLIIPWRPTLCFSRKLFSQMYGYSWRIMVTSVIGTFFDQLRSFFIGRYYTPADLAYANRGGQFPNMIAGNISGTLQSVLFPAFSHLKDDKDAVREAVRKSVATASFLIVGLMTVMAGTAETMIDVILSHRWIDTAPYLQCCCLLEVFAVLGSINLQTIKALGRADILLKLEFIKKPIYFVLILLGTMISPLAIVMGNMIYNLIGAAMNAWPNRKLLNYSLYMQFRDAMSPLFVAAFIFMVLQQVQNILPHTLIWWLIEGNVGLLVYGIIGKLLHFVGADYVYQILYRKIRRT